jgi:flagellar hook-associated protein 3 FlgL
MIYRSTWHGRMDFMSAAANRLGREMSEVNEKIATGKNINRPSDDPGRISQLHTVREELANQEMYTKNAGQSEQLHMVIDTALNDLHTTLSQAREMAVQFANEHYNPGQRAEAATLADSLREQLLSLANTQFDERSLFAGTAYDGAAFDSTGTYLGSTDEPEAVVGRNLTVKTGFDGSDMLTGSSDMFTALENLSTALAADDTAGITAAIDEIDLALADVQNGIVSIGVEMRRAGDAVDLSTNLSVQLSGAKANLEEANVVDAYTRLIQLQTNFEAAMQVAAVQRYSGLFSRM